MLSSCCNTPVIVWSRVLLVVINPPNIVSGYGFFRGWNMNQCVTGALKNVCEPPVCHSHPFNDAVMSPVPFGLSQIRRKSQKRAD